MNEFKSLQVRHFIDSEAQQVRVMLVIENLINSYNKKILNFINLENNTLQETKKEIKTIIDLMYKDIDKNLLLELKALGLYESNFQNKLLNKKSDVKNAEKLTATEVALLLSAGLLLGQTIKEKLAYQKIVFSNSINSTLAIVYNQKTTTKQAISAIRQNVLKNNNTQNQAITKTNANNIFNLSRLQTYEKNNIKRYQYVAILDSKTTDICRKLDGRVFNVDDPKAIRPPQHYNCRSTIAAIISNEDIFTENDTMKSFSETEIGKDLVIDNNNNYVLQNINVIPLSKRKAKDDLLLS